VPQPAQPARSRSLLQLYVWGGKNEQDDGQQVMHHLPAAEPHQLAGVLELADFSWSRANHTGAAFLALAEAEGELAVREGEQLDAEVMAQALGSFDEAFDHLTSDERREFLRLMIKQ
jgi:hypothetical protein